MKITAMTSTYPSSRMNSLSGCSHQPPSSPSTADSTNCIVTAAVGVFLTGWTRPKAAGSTPLRPIPNHMRVATFWHARLAPNTDVNMAIRATNHRVPQTRCAMTNAGSSGDETSLLRLLTPQPITWPQITSTSMSPIMTIDAIVARGTLRRGFSVSSASGTAASQPVRPCTVKTIARAKPVEVAILPGLKPYVNECSVKPPGPGSASPDRPRASTMRNSIAPTMTIVRMENVIP